MLDCLFIAALGAVNLQGDIKAVVMQISPGMQIVIGPGGEFHKSRSQKDWEPACVEHAESVLTWAPDRALLTARCAGA